MPANSSHYTALVTTIVGALVSIAGVFGVGIPQGVTTAVVTLILFAIAAVAHLHAQKVALATPAPSQTPTTVGIRPVAPTTTAAPAANVTAIPPVTTTVAPDDGPQRGA